MLSLGAAVFTAEGKQLSTFSVNLQLLPNAKADPDTMEFWAKNKDAYEATRVNPMPAQQGMEKFVKWVKEQPGSPVFVGYPASFDFLFVYWYIKHFGLDSPFSFSALDIKTYACAMLKTEYRKSTKKNMPKRWFSEAEHNHIAVDDAVEQGQLFINMMKENTS